MSLNSDTSNGGQVLEKKEKVKTMSNVELRIRMQHAWNQRIPDEWDAVVATVSGNNRLASRFDHLADRLEAGQRIYP